MSLGTVIIPILQQRKLMPRMFNQCCKQKKNLQLEIERIWVLVAVLGNLVVTNRKPVAYQLGF